MATLTTNHGASIGVTFYINNRLMKKILIILVGILILASCSRVSGTYESEKISLVDQVEFVGNSSCIVTYFGMKLPAKYRIDNGHIFVDAGQGLNLMFKILNSNTLVGESAWNNSDYRKVKQASNSGESE